jgi:aspartyl-tRNA(Asn)/glutamyl-tRNA(Gln) amidotransferase subunit A
MTADVAFLSIAALGRLYRTRRLSPVEATRACLARIAALDGRLNAFMTVLDGPALATARRAERELRAGVDRGALHGVPVALKDLIAMKGVPTTYGSVAPFHATPDRDGVIVARLRAAGAVIVGKTNLLEFGYGYVNPIVGQTNNPWHPGRTSGGSSGGSAAAVAAGMAYAAFGTDTGGSIRIPAAYCGVVGLKPTFGLVPLDGALNLARTLDHGGPLARGADDAAIMLGAMAGARARAARAADPRGLRLGVLRRYRDDPRVRPGVRAAFRATCAALVCAGARLVDLDPPELDTAIDDLLTIILPEGPISHARFYPRLAGSYADATRREIELGLKLPAVDYLRALDRRATLTAAVDGLFARCDALIGPSSPWEAPATDPALDSGDGAAEMTFIAPFNLTGHPAVSVPCGVGDDSLPVGFQIAGPRRADVPVLRLAGLVQRLRPLPRPPIG